MTQYPAYTPASSLGKELGIMFAFIGACVATMGVYSVMWRRIQLRTQEEDLARRKAFKNRTVTLPDTPSAANRLHYGGRNMGERVYEKTVDRYGGPGDRVELPANGTGMGIGIGIGNGNGNGNGELL